MAWRTPTAAAGILYEPHGAEGIAVGSPAWYTWLADEQHHSFRFIHPSGSFTARKEPKQRGRWYWVAYRQVQGKLYKTYLGKSKALTVEQLCAVAQALTRAAAADAGDALH